MRSTWRCDVGFVSSLIKLSAQSNAIQKQMDVGARLASAQASMTQAGRLMAASMPVATTRAQETDRLHATATVTSAQQQRMMIGMNAVVDLELVLMLPGGIPVPVRCTEQLAPLHLARVTPGSRLDVSLVPGMLDTVRIEWAG